MSATPEIDILAKLHAQIQEVCEAFQKVRSEAAGILHGADVPDAAAQLREVLQSTEDATMLIINSVTALREMAIAGLSAENAEALDAHVTAVYEACSFQDISGQRIKKVLGSLSVLEDGLAKLSETARLPENTDGKGNVSLTDRELMSGPQLVHVAPSQSDVDKLFGG